MRVLCEGTCVQKFLERADVQRQAAGHLLLGAAGLTWTRARGTFWGDRRIPALGWGAGGTAVAICIDLHTYGDRCPQQSSGDIRRQKDLAVAQISNSTTTST